MIYLRTKRLDDNYFFFQGVRPLFPTIRERKKEETVREEAGFKINSAMLGALINSTYKNKTCLRSHLTLLLTLAC